MPAGGSGHTVNAERINRDTGVDAFARRAELNQTGAVIGNVEIARRIESYEVGALKHSRAERETKVPLGLN